MSTEAPTRRSRGGAARRRRTRAFAGAFAAVLGLLVVLGLAGAAATSIQGPRETKVEFDPRAAAEASGARLIVTTNQSLVPVDAEQVRVSPAAPFTVDTAGRSFGVRFTLPLRDDTDYTVTVSDLHGHGGGPPATVTHRFRTPPLQVYLLQRSGSGFDDSIIRTDLDGTDPEAVLTHQHIEDFRVTAAHLVVSTRDAAGDAQLLVADLDGTHQRTLALPGKGSVATLQSADRGELIGYTFTDADIGKGGTQESRLYIASAKDGDRDAAPTEIPIPGADPRVLDWRFVPDTDSILVLTFAGRMYLTGADGSDATDLGTGGAIDGIARGSSIAIVQRADGGHDVDLGNGSEKPLVTAKDVPGLIGIVTPIPGVGAGTIRPAYRYDAPAGKDVTNIYRVADDGAAVLVDTVPAGDAVLQTCVSPSGRYAVVIVAPHAVDNPYDEYDLPMPKTVQTHIFDLTARAPVQTLTGFALSWCQVPTPVGQ